MLRRRPPGEGVTNNLVRALAIITIVLLVNAQQQQDPARRRFESPHDGTPPGILPTVIEATRVQQQTQVAEIPHTDSRRKSTIAVDFTSTNDIGKYDGNDASALAALAPAPAVRAPNSGSAFDAGLSQQVARSPENWEVEDFVLLATVDGQLLARDRKNGKQKWTLESEGPMIEVVHHRHNRSHSDHKIVDDYVWIVEPSTDGSLFVYVPGQGIVDTTLTMKKIVEEMSPHSDTTAGIMYVGQKSTSMMRIDAKTGNVLAHYGSGAPTFADAGKCFSPSGLSGTDDECSASGTSGSLVLGRTEYSVNILHPDIPDGQIASLKYSEWVPNNFDNDLLRQHSKTLDNKYVYSRHDGTVFAADLRDGSQSAHPIFKLKFSSPIAKVFDVHRPSGDQINPELVILPQPTPPETDDVFTIDRGSPIFVNITESGSWFALSGTSYPQVVHGPDRAPADAAPDLWQFRSLDSGADYQDDVEHDNTLRKALVGLHLRKYASSVAHQLTISDGPTREQQDDLLNSSQLLRRDSTSRLKNLSSVASNKFLELLLNPWWPIFLCLFLIITWKDVTKRVRSTYKSIVLPALASRGLLDQPTYELEPMKVGAPLEVGATPEKVVEILSPVSTADVASNEDQQPSEPESGGQDNGSQTGDPEIDPTTNNEESQDPPAEKQKKAHRGKRGGVRHKKGKARNATASEDPTGRSPSDSVEAIVRDVKKLGMTPAIEPDAQTIPNGVSEVSGPILRLGSLEVDTDKLIGVGSNGTLVYEGKFDGRPVAVKRMLMVFFELASQETKLLRESDDHQNVIRYYAQQESDGFLYIALELCPASLSDVIEKPQLHRDIAQSGEKDLPNVLYQITNGLSHLHSLRIVHRDLKPQNILVSMSKDGRPRMLVSDFGLCKKLEGEQSSFRATTHQAAGTHGWRAPELLLDDDARDGQTMIDASTHSGNGSMLANDTPAPTRRATRAIDIFSLGLVFFYVLTQGRHPFDCGDKYMREVNIRKGNYNLEPLQVLGDYAYEAHDLIESMINKDPLRRPTARQIMAHPFFWSAKKRLNFLCDVSDHFEKEPRLPPLGPSKPLQILEQWAPEVTHGDFLKPLGKEFVESMGKQRKYTGSKLLDLLRALRNKRNHYEDMSDSLKEKVGSLPEGYLTFWTRRFPNLLLGSWNVVYETEWDREDRFAEYYSPPMAVTNM